MNVFLFSHGPMTITLADVLMLIGLNISGLVTPPFLLLDQVTHKLLTKDVRGWSKYMYTHVKIGSIDDREYVTFLKMCLRSLYYVDQHLGQLPITKV